MQTTNLLVGFKRSKFVVRKVDQEVIPSIDVSRLKALRSSTEAAIDEITIHNLQSPRSRRRHLQKHERI